MKRIAVILIAVLSVCSIDAKRLYPLTPSQFKGSMDANGFSITNAGDFATDSGISLTGLAYQVENMGADTNLTARVAGLEGGTNNWNDAFSWGNHTLFGYLTSFTEADPLWTSQSGAVFSAISGKMDTNAASQFATAAQGAMADSSVQTNILNVSTNVDADVVFNNPDGSFGFIVPPGQGLSVQGDLAASGYIVSFVDDLGVGIFEDYYVYPVHLNDDRYATTAQGATADTAIQPGDSVTLADVDADSATADSLTLDRTINDWGDIGLTYTDAVRLNPPVTITNDATWAGWTTTGTLTDGVIKLGHGEYLESPPMSNGVSSASYESWSDMGCTTGKESDTPDRTAGAKWRVTGDFFGVPGATPGLYVSNVTLITYTDLLEAQSDKQVNRLKGYDAPREPHDLTNMQYVDNEVQAAKDYSATELTTYAEDIDKTVVCSRLRIGEEYELIGSGDIWAVNGCQITGGGELVSTEYGLGITRNGHQLLSFKDSASGLYITNFTVSTSWTVDIATNGIVDTPFLEWSPSLTQQDWQVLPDSGTVTGAVHRIVISSPPTNDTVFVRAMQPVGTSAVVIDADALVLKDSNGDSWVVSISTNGTLTTTKED